VDEIQPEKWAYGSDIGFDSLKTRKFTHNLVQKVIGEPAGG
jgi:hypothetical protein